jgi:hypothetical protein
VVKGGKEALRNGVKRPTSALSLKWRSEKYLSLTSNRKGT